MDGVLAALGQTVARWWAWLSDERQGRTATGLWVVAVLVMSAMAHGPALCRLPDRFDESQYIRMMAPLGWRDLGRWCITPYETFPYFRPLGFLSLFVDRMVWGRPSLRHLPDGSVDLADLERQAYSSFPAFPYRLTNLVVFTAASLAFGMMMGRLGRSRTLGGLAGLAYVVAPENRLTVVYYPERFILLVALFSFLAVYAFFGQFGPSPGPRWRGYLCVPLFAAALLSKEHALVLPVILVVWMLLLVPRVEWRRAAGPLLAMGVVVALYLAWRFGARGFFFRDDIAGAARLARFRLLPIRFMVAIPWATLNPALCWDASPWMLLTGRLWHDVFHLAAFWGSAYLLLRRRCALLVCLLAWVPIMYLPVAHAYAFDLFPYKLYLPNAAPAAIGALAVWQWGQVALAQPWPYRLLIGVALGCLILWWAQP